MPLTFAHPAAILPLARSRLSLSALVVGSMAPDMLYFARLAPSGHFGHTLPGLVLFCLPVGLAVLWVFHRLLKRSLLALCPVLVQRRLGPAVRHVDFLPLIQGSWLAASVLVGAATHVVWDAFTHPGGWGLVLFPMLSRSVAIAGMGSVMIYKLAQHGSTLVGLTVLTVAVALWWRKAPVAEVRLRLPAPTRWRWFAVLVGVPLVFGSSYAATAAVGSGEALRLFLGYFVIGTTTAFFVLATAYGVWHRLRDLA